MATSYRALRGRERDDHAIQEAQHTARLGVRLATKRGHKRAIVDVARKLATIMHHMWIDGSQFALPTSEVPGTQPVGFFPAA
jgi:hypothetical protein